MRTAVRQEYGIAVVQEHWRESNGADTGVGDPMQHNHAASIWLGGLKPPAAETRVVCGNDRNCPRVRRSWTQPSGHMQRRATECRTGQSETYEASDDYGGADSDDGFPGQGEPTS